MQAATVVEARFHRRLLYSSGKHPTQIPRVASRMSWRASLCFSDIGSTPGEPPVEIPDPGLRVEPVLEGARVDTDASGIVSSSGRAVGLSAWVAAGAGDATAAGLPVWAPAGLALGGEAEGLPI
jgi:hypothetical protein